MESQNSATLRLPLKSNRPATPQTDGKAASGTVIFTNSEPELIVDRVNAPFLDYVEGAIEVTGNSMEPTFSNGCRIAISRIRDRGIINWGLCYLLIDINMQLFVRRVYEGKACNSIRLVADNPDQVMFPTFERQWEDLEAVFRITAWIIKQ